MRLAKYMIEEDLEARSVGQTPSPTTTNRNMNSVLGSFRRQKQALIEKRTAWEKSEQRKNRKTAGVLPSPGTAVNVSINDNYRHVHSDPSSDAFQNIYATKDFMYRLN